MQFAASQVHAATCDPMQHMRHELCRIRGGLCKPWMAKTQDSAVAVKPPTVLAPENSRHINFESAWVKSSWSANRETLCILGFRVPGLRVGATAFRV